VIYLLRYPLSFILVLIITACSSVAVTPSSPACDNAAAPLSTPTDGITTSLSIPTFTYKVINSYPHDPAAFTEGLEWANGVLYESTGEQSTLRRVELNSGKVLQSQALSPEYFGEGITVWKDQIIQLTWQSHLGFVYDKTTFKLLKQFNYPTEGWGLTHDGTYLIMSDGTPIIHFLEPNTLQEVKTIEVHDAHGPLVNVNELEYVCGEIFANIWLTDRIARISPATGQVIGWIDLSGLLNPQNRVSEDGVLNGIAYDTVHDRLFVTGKLWPQLFEIKLIPALP
jgi:glutamine cyclotransferase